MSMACVYLCDSDRLYAGRLHGYLRERIRLPLRIMEYTDVSYLPRTEGHRENALLVIAEQMADPAVCNGFRAVLVLTEEETGGGGGFQAAGKTEGADHHQNETTIVCMSRYQRASVIAGQLLELLACLDGSLAAKQKGGKQHRHVTAYYSPLGRCMQTSMALASGQILSMAGRALYVGFDTFPVSALTGESLNGDITDLLYYADVAREKLPVYLERIKRRIGNLEFIPPAPSVYRTQGADGKEMIALLQAVCEDDRPDVLLLDLTEHAPGLTDLLSFADEVITITGHDRADAEKIDAYKRWLAGNGMEDILQKTRFCRLPRQCRLPPSPDRLMNSSLGTYIQKNGLLPGNALAAAG